jgi:hypothetical protein
LRCPGVRLLKFAALSQDAGFQERLHQRQNPFISDSNSNPLHQRGVRDFIEARFDVPFHDPLIRAARVEVNLGNCVLGAAFGAEAIGEWLKIRLENWLKHQFEGGLDHSIPHSGDTQTTALVGAGLGNRHLAYGKRLELPSLELISQLGQKSLLPPDGRDVVGDLTIYASCASPSIAPHPVPGLHQHSRVIDQVP